MASARNRARFDHAREFPFNLIIVNTFADLFGPARVIEDGAAAIKRRILSGFFIAIEKILRPDTTEYFQRRSRGVVSRLDEGSGAQLNWQVVNGDPVADEICIDAMISFLPCFADLLKRMYWFIALVNGSLSPLGGDTWELTEASFYNFTAEFFSGLRLALADTADRAALARRYSTAKLDALDQAFDTIDQALDGPVGKVRG